MVNGRRYQNGSRDFTWSPPVSVFGGVSREYRRRRHDKARSPDRRVPGWRIRVLGFRTFSSGRVVRSQLHEGHLTRMDIVHGTSQPDIALVGLPLKIGLRSRILLRVRTTFLSATA